MGLRERLAMAGSLRGFDAAAPGPAPDSAGDLLALGRRIEHHGACEQQPVVGYMYFGGQAEASEAALMARDLGWEPELRAPTGLVREWVVAARADLDISAGGVDRIHRELGAIAETLDGEFEGWDRIES